MSSPIMMSSYELHYENLITDRNANDMSIKVKKKSYKLVKTVLSK
jgi:hypothetical protein